MENNEVKNVELQSQIKANLKEVEALRKDGTTKIHEINRQLRDIKNNKKLDKETKSKLIAAQQSEIAEAKNVEKANSAQVKELVKTTVKMINEEYKPLLKEASVSTKAEIKNLKAVAKEKLNAAKQKYQQAVAEVKSAGLTKEETEIKLKNLKLVHNNEVFEIKNDLNSDVQKQKDLKHNLFLEKMQLVSTTKNDKLSPVDKVLMSIENYIYNFKLKDFLMKNGLYIIILLFMLYCIMVKPQLTNVNNSLNILKNFSTKVFFALGVAGLILLGGTDLSIGRMVTLGSIFTCMLLNPTSTTEFFGVSISGLYNQIGFVPTAILALVLSITLCTAFSAVAGFFTAKFKIHPFITTLSTSLVIWGLVDYGTGNVKTGTVTDAASSLVQSIFKVPGFNGIPLTLIYAIVTIFVVWFIWNKTKFGKNMYAVGGNQEAAAVSGISVFKVTLSVFLMAGVLYGIGAFLIGIQTGSSSSTFGQGWELEAIAACVVGGISFSGGIGKISGAVIGCLLFEVLKYYLRAITGGSLGITNIFIGVIILIAVIFDSIKYLKKK